MQSYYLIKTKGLERIKSKYILKNNKKGGNKYRLILVNLVLYLINK
tara:strand:- start:296 stop:433 length:138 start_codon:yes stop_codon:yes gene_type:complete